MEQPPELGVLLITGVMAAGKSAIAQALAERLPRSVHLRGDVFRRFVVGGRAEPTPQMRDEEGAQLRLRYRLATQAADTYSAAGFAVVLQDVIIGPALSEVVQMITTRPRHVVVLDPDAEVVADRERSRSKSGYAGGWTADGLVTALRTSTPRLGLWLNTSDLVVDETAELIMDRIDEARVDD